MTIDELIDRFNKEKHPGRKAFWQRQLWAAILKKHPWPPK